MSRRIKILLAVLVVSAGLAFWYVASYTSSGSTQTPLSANILQTTTTQDTDNDGLIDSEETYWGTDFRNPDSDGDGFKDGEEVLSGHNPAKAGPNDLLDSKTNLTQRASTLLLGGLATGDLDPSSANYESAINGLVEKIFQQYSDNTTAELDSIVTSTNNQNDVLSYGMKMSRILQTLFTNTANGFASVIETIKDIPTSDISKLRKDKPNTFSAFSKEIDAQLSMLDAQAIQLKSVKVPPSLLQAHRNELIFIRGVQQQYRALRAIDRDPLQGIIAMQMLATLTTATAAELTTDFTNRLSDAFSK
jgi:hypothetical protein